MSINLIMIGITLFFAAAVFCVMDPQRKEQKWVLASLVLPFIAIPYYRRRWDELFILGYAQVTGIVLIIIGLFFLVEENTTVVNGTRVLDLGSSASQRFTNEYTGNKLTSEEEDPNAALRNYMAGSMDKELSGMIHGQKFKYGRAELIDGVLRIKHDTNFYSSLEVAIHWGIDEKELEGKATKFVVPRSEDPPEVYVSWLEGNTGVPQTDIFRRGYHMELTVARIQDNRLRGELKLLLPDEYGSKISGRFTAYTDNLHYKNGEIDLDFDHKDTLEYVASEYLKTQFAEDAILDISYVNTHFKPISKIGSTTATVKLNDGAVIEQEVGLQKNVAGWIVDADRLGERVTLVKASDSAIDLFADDVLKDPRLERQRELERQKRNLKVPDPITLDFADLAKYSNKEVLAVTRSGKKQQGLFTGIRKNRIVIEAFVGAGTVEYFITDEELKSVTILSSRQLINVNPPPSE